MLTIKNLFAGHRPHHQREVDHSTRHPIVYPNENLTTAETFSSSNTRVEIRLKKGEFGEVDDVRLRLSITENSAAALTAAAIPFWFDRIEVRTAESKEEIIRTIYSDEFWMYVGWTLEDEHERSQYNFYGNRGQNPDVIAASGSRVYTLRIPFSLFNQVSIDGEFLSYDLLLNLYLRNGIVATGSGTAKLTNVELITDERQHHEPSARLAYEKVRREGLTVRYLDTLHVDSGVASAWTAETRKEIVMDDLTGSCAGLAVLVRSSRSITDSAITTCAYMGREATVDIVDKAGKSIYALGNAITLEFLNQQLPPAMRDFCRAANIVFIPFSEDFMRDLSHGTITKYRKLPANNKYRLQITPAAAITNAVYTFNCTNPANDGGAYRLGWAGESTASLAYGANVATMKAAFETLKVMKDNGLTATFSDTAATDFTLTIAGANFDTYKAFGLPALHADSLADGGVGEICVITNSTAYVDGSNVGGSSFYYDLYAWVHREAHLDGKTKQIHARYWF